MSNNNENYNSSERLLSEQERVAFKMISTGNDLHGQRALALLAIDEGSTQAQAAQQAGLTPGQVKYWLAKFREIRLAIFPDQVLEAAGQHSQPEMAEEAALKLRIRRVKAKARRKRRDQSKQVIVLKRANLQ
jgi:transposase-like protein